jgi:O-antigen/teichoic acid export membrane protein
MIKRLFGDSFIYGITGYLTVIAGIILTPIYTRILSKSEYGIMDIFNTWNTFAMAILPIGLITSIVTFYPEVSDNLKKKKALLGTILSSISVLSIIYVIIMLFLKEIFIKYINEPNLSEIYYQSIYIVIASLFVAYVKVVLQTKFQKYRYALITITNFIILSLLGFVFVYYYDMRILGFFRAMSLSMSLTILLGIILIKKEIYFEFDKTILKKLLNYSSHLLSVFFLFQAINLVDRYILLEFGSLEDVGVYNIGTKISGIVKIVFAAFATAWFPIAMSIKEKEDSIKTYRLVHNVYFFVTLILLSSLFIFRKELIIFFAPDYLESYNLIGILAVAYAVNGSIYIYSLGLHIKKKTKYLTTSAILSIITNLVSSIFFIKIMGIDGVAWGTLIGGVVWVISQLYYSQKAFYIKYDFLYSLFVIILLIVIMFSIPMIENSIVLSMRLTVLSKVILIIIFSIILYFYLKKNLSKI